MRWLPLALAAVLASQTTSVAAAPEFPYTAYVASDGVTIRSGPGSHFYPCDRLPAGEPVEVYRHDPGGWCALRPPEGSFSWVAGRYLRRTEAGLAVVEQPRVPARVGSRFSSVRDVIQVRLDEGETVEVLGEGDVVGEATRPEWVRIAPPAGEFRWIHADFLTTSPPEGVRAPAPAALEDARQENASGSSADERDGAKASSWNARSHRDSPARSTSHHAVDLASGECPAASAVDPAVAPAEATSAPQPGAEPQDHPPLAAEPLAPETEPGTTTLDDVELDLSMMVAGDASRWRLAPLRREVERVVGESPSPAVRGRGRALLSKLGRFEDIQSRHFALLGIAPAQAGLDSPLGRPPGREGPFDGQGRLTLVVSRKPGAPQFALLNPAGEVTCFVTASPGTNLRPYLGKQVGLTGIRGYMPELKTRHVTARRVTVLDPPQWR
jgi:SH3-like domain-containing protein